MADRSGHLVAGASILHVAQRISNLFSGPGDNHPNIRCSVPEGDAVRHLPQELLAVQDLHRREDRIHDTAVRPRDGVHLLRH